MIIYQFPSVVQSAFNIPDPTVINDTTIPPNTRTLTNPAGNSRPHHRDLSRILVPILAEHETTASNNSVATGEVGTTITVWLVTSHPNVSYPNVTHFFNQSMLAQILNGTTSLNSSMSH